MPPLLDTQARFAAAVVRGEMVSAVDLVIDDAPGATARLAIYANHFRITLIEALASTFPVVRRLVGSDFFAAAARAFIRERPPAGPCLFEYGGAFPAFLDRLPAASSLPWLGDVASLEWAISEAWHEEDADPLPSEALLRFTAGDATAAVGLHPSCRLVQSPFPVDRIWQAHERSDDAIETVDLSVGGARLLVHRQDDNVAWLRLDNDADLALIAALCAGEGLRGAVAAAAGHDAAWDPTPLLAALIAADLLVSTAN